MTRGIPLRARPFVAVVLATSLGACGAQTPPTPRPVCELPRTGETEADRLREPTNAELVHLVLGASADVGDRAPAQECSGERIGVRHSECEGDLAALPAVSVTDEQIITRRVSDVEQLVWIVTHSNGVEGEGPVALIEKLERGLGVRAIGTLRAELGRPRLKLTTSGQTLVAETERCENDDDPSTCERTAHLLARNGDRFERVPLRHRETRRCLGGPDIALSRRFTRELPDGWRREFELAASWEEAGDSIVVHETVTMHDTDPRAPSIPARPFREVSSDRSFGHGMEGEHGPLLERAVEEFGSVHAPVEDGPRAERD